MNLTFQHTWYFQDSMSSQTPSKHKLYLIIIQESNSSSYIQPLVTTFLLLFPHYKNSYNCQKKSYLKISKKTPKYLPSYLWKVSKILFKLRQAIMKTWWHFPYKQTSTAWLQFLSLVHFVRLEPLLSQTAPLGCSQISQKNAQSNQNNITYWLPSPTRELMSLGQSPNIPQIPWTTQSDINNNAWHINGD